MDREFLRSSEYLLISAFYGDRRAKRSGVPYMNHIDEGLAIMEGRSASMEACLAYCLHPMLQEDSAFAANYKEVALYCDPHVAMLAVEYRRAANAYLCTPRTDEWGMAESQQAVGMLVPEVREMLIADKIQNQKDFRQYHLGTHPRSEQLERYFVVWLELLGCTDARG